MPISTTEFKPGDRVIYIPRHAHGDALHPDCERGIVSSINDAYVFVRYTSGDTAAATSPHDLQHAP